MQKCNEQEGAVGRDVRGTAFCRYHTLDFALFGVGGYVHTVMVVQGLVDVAVRTLGFATAGNVLVVWVVHLVLETEPFRLIHEGSLLLFT